MSGCYNFGIEAAGLQKWSTLQSAKTIAFIYLFSIVDKVSGLPPVTYGDLRGKFSAWSGLRTLFLITLAISRMIVTVRNAMKPVR